MPDITITAKPSREWQRFVREGDDRLRDVAQEVVKRATFDAEAEAKRNAPRVTGALIRSIHSRLNELPRLRAHVRVQEPYGRRVENLSQGGAGSRGRRGPRYIARAVATVESKVPRFWREELEKLLD